VLKGHDSSVSSVAFSPDAKKIVTGSWDKTTRVWTVGEETLLAALWDATSDCLDVEWRQALLLESPEEARANHQCCRQEVARRRGWSAP